MYNIRSGDTSHVLSATILSLFIIILIVIRGLSDKQIPPKKQDRISRYPFVMDDNSLGRGGEKKRASRDEERGEGKSKAKERKKERKQDFSSLFPFRSTSPL